MKRLNFLRILFVIPILLGSMLTVTPAYAGGPVRSEYTYSEDYELIGVCQDVTIIGHNFGTVYFKTWVDENGQKTREFQGFGQTHGTWSANGKTLSLNSSGPMHITFVSDTEWIVKYTGPMFKLELPGHGTVFGGAFQAIETWIFDGAGNREVRGVKFSGFWKEDWEAICEYFAE